MQTKIEKQKRQYTTVSLVCGRKLVERLDEIALENQMSRNKLCGFLLAKMVAQSVDDLDELLHK
ncbi:MAG: hypothetical protein F4039_07360 [Gammaproteobacteria bacterium]|nr:hypothetical protein [Gammaproteobacteria bacterium]MYK43887.1 hypothetical protein [Gammaproteobacteria bacterium]